MVLFISSSPVSYKFYIIFIRLLDGSSALKSAPAGFYFSLSAPEPVFFVRLIQTFCSSFLSVIVTLFDLT